MKHFISFIILFVILIYLGTVSYCCTLTFDNGGDIEALGTICMKTADNKVLTGWLASQTDILSEDWNIVEE